MADVSITIRKSSAGADSTISIAGQVDDTAITPITSQLTSLLCAAANSVSGTPPV